jgi:hypothetical protein
MARNTYQLLKEIQELEEIGFEVECDRDISWVHVTGLELPAKGIWTTENNERIFSVSVLIDIPPSWPLHPPGVGLAHPSHAIHIPYLEYNGEKINDLHACSHEPWHWLCFQNLYWKPEFGLPGLLQVIEKTIWERR